MTIEGRKTAMTLESAIEIVVDDPVLATFPYWQQMATIGVSPHITLLYPWRSAPVDDASINALHGVVRHFEPFSLTLSQVATFPKGVVYVVVEPVPLLGSLMATLAGRFPTPSRTSASSQVLGPSHISPSRDANQMTSRPSDRSMHTPLRPFSRFASASPRSTSGNRRAPVRGY